MRNVDNFAADVFRPATDCLAPEVGQVSVEDFVSINDVSGSDGAVW